MFVFLGTFTWCLWMAVINDCQINLPSKTINEQHKFEKYEKKVTLQWYVF